MKKIILVISLFVMNFALAESFSINKEVLKGEKVKFLSHQGQGKWDNYLVMNLPFEPVAKLFAQVLTYEKRSMTNRGEAHITVLTPVEYWNHLKPLGIKMSEIDKIARDNKIQSSKYKIICLGAGKAFLSKKIEKTYFLVVESDNFLKIRKEIQNLVIKKGGSQKDFNPDAFYPHITLGFTLRDLHLESDGVKKDLSSCQFKVSLK